MFCEAIQKLAVYDVGCLVTTDANGKKMSWHPNAQCETVLICIFTDFFVMKIYIVYQSGKLSGVVSECDYITKIALLGKTVSNELNYCNASDIFM